MSDLPRGTVTFLFTDVEGSTQLLRRLGDAYLQALSDHRRLLRECVQEAHGHEIDCRGDEFFIAFQRTSDALSAALAVQRSLQVHEWPDGATLRIRMGIHTGEATIADDSYVGLDVHRAARICSAGHGGQVLVSQTSYELLGGRDALGVELRDLGEHTLKGLPRPERLFQVVAPELPASFPPLRIDKVDSAVAGELATDAPRAAPAGGNGAPATRPKRLRVVLADDSVLLREGIARLLEDAGLEVVGQAGTAEDLLLKVRSYDPDVAIVDIRMPPTQTNEGLRAAQEIRSKHPRVGVLVLSQHVEPAYAMELLSESAEGVGYLLKDRVSDVEEFASAVRRVGEGGSALDPAIVSQLVGRRRHQSPLEELTPREREVLELMAEGRSNQGIAERLVVTERAVEKHVTSIFGKLRLPAAPEDHRRVLAVLTLLRA